MNILNTHIDGVVVVETTAHQDTRGGFYRAFCQRELASVVGERQIAQINVSKTRSIGVIRGMHFQLGLFAEMKLVRCLKGRVFDVALDLRAGSPTYLKWHAEELSEDNSRLLVIPEGCAHGFQTLAPDTELLYLHTAIYTPEAEGGLRFDDPALSINWPLPAVGMSQRDKNHPYISSNFQGISL